MAQHKIMVGIIGGPTAQSIETMLMYFIRNDPYTTVPTLIFHLGLITSSCKQIGDIQITKKSPTFLHIHDCLGVKKGTKEYHVKIFGCTASLAHQDGTQGQKISDSLKISIEYCLKDRTGNLIIF